MGMAQKRSEDTQSRTGDRCLPRPGPATRHRSGREQRKLLAEVVSLHSRQIIEGILQIPSENSSKDRGVAPTPSPCLPVINNLYNVVLRLDLIRHDGMVIN